MSFLNPILLFGMGAVAAPIIIHLLNRRRFQRVAWGAMRFLKASVERNRRRMRVEDLLLLFLRCLLLVLIAIGLARPALMSETGGLFGQTKVTGILILDASYSMGTSDGVATRFEKARAAAEEVLDVLPAGSSLAVWLAADDHEGIIPEPTFDLNLARRAVQEAILTDRGTDLFPALRAAVDALRDRFGARREIYLITDGQALAWRQLTRVQELLNGARGEIGLHVVLVQDAERRNASVSDLRLTGGLAPVGQPVRFEARIHNHGDEEAQNKRVTLSVDGQAAQDEVTIDSVAAGSSRTVSLFAKLTTPGYHGITVRISPDRLEADDQRTVAVRGLRNVRVLLVDGEPGNQAREWETFFLAQALQPVAPEHRSDYFIQIQRVTTSELAQTRLDDFDGIVLANVPDLPAEVVEALPAYLRRGGGLIIFLGSRVNTAFYNQQLFDRTRILPAALGPAAGEATQQEQYVTLAPGKYEHPILDLWNDAQAGTLVSARFYRRIILTPAPNESATLPEGPAAEAGPARLVGQYSDGGAAIMERTWGLGRVVLFGSTADTAWNDLPVRPAFVPLVHRVLGALLSRQDEGLNIRVGERFVHQVPSEYLNQEALFSRDQEAGLARQSQRVKLMGGRPIVQYDQTERAGLYDVEVGEPSLKLKFATQADSAESNLEPRTRAQEQALSGLADVLHWESGMELRERMQQMRTGMELWLPLVLAAFVLALVESALGQWFSRPK